MFRCSQLRIDGIELFPAFGVDGDCDADIAAFLTQAAFYVFGFGIRRMPAENFADGDMEDFLIFPHNFNWKVTGEFQQAFFIVLSHDYCRSSRVY